MKLVIGIVRPEKANDVLEALYRAEVRGVVGPSEGGLGLDVVQHGGEAYVQGDGAILISPEAGLEAARAVAQP